MPRSQTSHATPLASRRLHHPRDPTPHMRPTPPPARGSHTQRSTGTCAATNSSHAPVRRPHRRRALRTCRAL